MATRIRLATIQDVDCIFDIRTSVNENHLSRAELAQMGITDETIEQTIAAADCTWIAEVDGTPVGFAMADAEAGSVFAAFIKPAGEGMGLGRQLMEHAERFLFARHDTLWLETDGSSRAYGFYRRLGWLPVQTLGNGDVRLQKTKKMPA